MSKVIVAGANGFIGRNLTESLRARGRQVTALGNSFAEDLGQVDKRVRVKDKSMDELFLELRGAEYSCFYDLAWSGTSGSSRADYNVQLDNVRTTCDYVKLAAALKCPRFIYASSVNETETYEYFQGDDIEPTGGYVYGAGKLAARIMGETAARMNGIGFIPVIITNVYGVGEKSARMINTSIRKLLQGERCSFTAGFQTYDFIYVTDAINSIIAVAEKGRAFNSYYIGSGEPKPLREFLTEMRDVVNPDVEIGLGDVPFKGADISYSQFDLKKVERETGYKNQVSFREGIRRTADHIRREADDRA